MTGPIHATAIEIAGCGVLLVGPPGSGKSDLAIRLIDRGALLVADDRVVVQPRGASLILSAPASIAGLIEVRGVGILARTSIHSSAARLIVDLSRPPDRLPEPEYLEIEGVVLPVLRLNPFESSAPVKVEWALALLADAG